MVFRFPRWYLVTLATLFVLYLGGWLLTVSIFATAYQNAGEVTVQQIGVINVTGGDSGEYVALGNSLLHGRFALPGEAYDYFRTPGYPAFIALIEFLGGSYLAITFLQILMTFGTALMIRNVGTRLFSSSVGIIASFLFLINPLVIVMTLQIMTDIPFTFLLFLSAVLFISYVPKYPLRAVIGAALVCVAATYIRPAGFVALPIFLAPLFAVPIPFVRKIQYSIFFVAIFGLLLIPWMFRNYEHSGIFAFSSLAAYNLTSYNVPMFEAVEHHTSDIAERADIAEQTGIPILEWRDLNHQAALEQYDRTALLAAPMQYIAYHSFESTGFFVNSGVGPLLSFFSGRLHYTLPPADPVSIKDLLIHGEVLAFMQAVTTPWWILVERIMLIFGLVFIAFGLWIVRRKAFAWVGIFTILYFALLAGPVAEARYRLPAEPFIALLIASGLVATYHAIWHRIQKISTRTLARSAS